MNVTTENQQAISLREHCLVIQAPLRVLSREEAIAHAAWLVALADLLPGDGAAAVQFLAVYDSIRKDPASADDRKP